MMPKKKSIPKKRVLFNVLGDIKIVDGRKRFVPYSIHHLNACISRFPAGKKVSATFSEIRYMRSDAQLRYHHVLVEYIATHTGYTHDECHDVIMRDVFGEKPVTIGGKTYMARKSIADHGDVMKNEAVGLIDRDLAICEEYEITVPTAEELGYTVDNSGRAV